MRRFARVLIVSAVCVSAGTAAGQEAEPQWEKPFPLGFSLDYTLVSDYVWRGINLSEYAGEGREKPNHQMCVAFSLDTADLMDGNGSFGAFGGSIWFEWYAGQHRLTPWTGTNLQEVDYDVNWSYEIAPVFTTVELGWVAYHLPPYRRSGSPGADISTTYEVYGKLYFDDSAIFGQPVLNPYVAYYQDIDTVEAGWLEFGVSHDFALAELGLEDTPFLKNITITPSAVLGVSHRYYDKSGVGSANSIATRLANIEYGLAIDYDLSGALGIPEQYGSLSVGGFMNYSQALHDVSASVNDEFYGGLTVGYSW